MARSLRKKIILAACAAALGIGGWIGYSFVHTLRLLPEAYAAWDSGTLLVEYMTRNDRWPSSWDELLTVLDTPTRREIRLRGSQAGDMNYVRSLRKVVSIDWQFDTARPRDHRLVTRPDGSAFLVLFADPNTMIDDYLRDRAATRPSNAR